MTTCRYCGEPQIFNDHTRKKEIKPVACCDHGVLNWYDMECTNKPHDLYTADQLREAQVKVLREAAEHFERRGYQDVIGRDLRRMADELEEGK